MTTEVFYTKVCLADTSHNLAEGVAQSLYLAEMRGNWR